MSVDNKKSSAPLCVGVIMDGSRRFAKERNLQIFQGHEAGYEKLKEFVRWAKEAGVKNVITYAFSTENWHRSEEEVGFLMKLLESIVIDRVDELLKEKVRVRIIGQRERLSEKTQTAIKKLEQQTEKFKDFTLVVAISYGGRAEIVEAVNKIIKENKAVISEKDFSKFLWTADIPDPDIVIRTSGEMRTSNFLPWQSAYSEWFFTKTYWPAFTKEEFLKILEDFSKRERRNGK